MPSFNKSGAETFTIDIDTLILNSRYVKKSHPRSSFLLHSIQDRLAADSNDDVFAASPSAADVLLQDFSFLPGLSAAVDSSSDADFLVVVNVVRMLFEQTTSADDVTTLTCTILPRVMERAEDALEQDACWKGLADMLAACHAGACSAAAQMMGLRMFPVIVSWCVAAAQAPLCPPARVREALALMAMLLNDDDVREFVEYEPASLGISRAELTALCQWLDGCVALQPRLQSCTNAAAATLRATDRIRAAWSAAAEARKLARETKRGHGEHGHGTASAAKRACDSRTMSV